MKVRRPGFECDGVQGRQQPSQNKEIISRGKPSQVDPDTKLLNTLVNRLKPDPTRNIILAYVKENLRKHGEKPR